MASIIYFGALSHIYSYYTLIEFKLIYSFIICFMQWILIAVFPKLSIMIQNF